MSIQAVVGSPLDSLCSHIMGETSGSTETAQSKTAWLSWIYPEVFKSHEGRWEIIPPRSFFLPHLLPSPSFWPSLTPWYKFLSLPSLPLPWKSNMADTIFTKKILSTRSCKKCARANRLTLMQEMGPAVYPSVATRQFNHLFCNDKRNWVACNLHRDPYS